MFVYNKEEKSVLVSCIWGATHCSHNTACTQTWSSPLFYSRCISNAWSHLHRMWSGSRWTILKKVKVSKVLNLPSHSRWHAWRQWQSTHNKHTDRLHESTTWNTKLMKLVSCLSFSSEIVLRHTLLHFSVPLYFCIALQNIWLGY